MRKKFIVSILSLSILTATIANANDITKNDKIHTKVQKKICLTEACMSTTKLQEEVEKRSIEGNLPFEMGLELIKRWSDNKIS